MVKKVLKEADISQDVSWASNIKYDNEFYVKDNLVYFIQLKTDSDGDIISRIQCFDYIYDEVIYSKLFEKKKYNSLCVIGDANLWMVGQHYNNELISLTDIYCNY